ncbi:MAG: hypothetical protein LAO79_13905 [Acidobacteriia bacterium]|nr:hypothetical protein [Terriglobia bacterium]
MKRFLTCALVLAAASLTALAEKPNFSGEWTLNADKSNLGPMPPPQSMTRKVEHSDPALTMTQATVGGPQGDQTVTMKISTDGKETTNEMMGTPAKTKATWDGDALVINLSVDFGGTEIKLTEKWSLGDDGKTLTDTTHIVAPQGEFDVVYVMNKK